MIRYAICVLLGLGLLSGALALSVLIIQNFAEIGRCVTNRAIQVLIPCPDASLPLLILFFASIFAGLIGAGIYAARAADGSTLAEGPNWGGFWWPALFVSVGVLFWSMALRVEPDQGTEARIVWWVFAGCAAMFLVMGITPVLAAWRRLPALLFGGPGAARGSLITPAAARQAQAGLGGASFRSATAKAAPDGSADIAQSLERLNTLHRQGVLSDAEFAAAKASVLRGDRG